ncbi:unnamed protein product, partial [Rotaria sp. Silwood1]
TPTTSSSPYAVGW